MDFTGLVINSKYIVIHQIGEGAFATVWLSYDMTNKLFYAIKIHNADSVDEGTDEIQIFDTLRKEKCPYIATLINHFVHKSSEGKHVCLVTELCAGSIFDIMDADNDSRYEHGYPENTVKRVTKQLLIAMSALNKRKVIHTDIKPENILVVGQTNKIKSIMEDFENKYNLLKKKDRHNKNKINHIVKNLDTESDSDCDSDDESSDSDSGSDTSTTNSSDFSSDDTCYESDCAPSDDDSSDNESIDSTNTHIDDQLITNIRIQLSDFGNSVFEEDLTHNIQSRNYRAPEVLLKCKINERCDVWSVGCTIYELLTGDMLFEPHHLTGSNRNREHLHEIQQKIGQIPQNIITQSTKMDRFFKNDKTLKGSYTTHHEKYGEKIKNKKIVDLMDKMFCFDPLKRISVEECLKHEWFNTSV